MFLFSLKYSLIRYKFEEMEGDDPEFDTREDFLEGLLQDYNQG